MSCLSSRFSSVTIIFGTTTLFFGACTMSAEINLTWEWPGERTPDTYVEITIKKVKSQKEGIFSFFRSPSVVNNIPEGMTVIGTVNSTDDKLSGRLMKATIPKPELGDLKVGDTAVLGLIDDAVCICVGASREELNSRCP